MVCCDKSIIKTSMHKQGASLLDSCLRQLPDQRLHLQQLQCERQTAPSQLVDRLSLQPSG